MSLNKTDTTVYPEDIQCIVDPINGKGGIYISNVQAAQNLATLKRYGIKAVLTAAVSIDLKHTKQNVPFYKKVPGEDHQNFDLSKYFNESVTFIENGLRTTNVLVHCMAGVSRSVSLVLAYFIKVKGMSYDDSYSLVKGKRKIIYPNDGFIRQLKNYQKQFEQKEQRSTIGQMKQESPKKSTIKISEQFKNILSKYDSPPKLSTTFQKPTYLDYPESKHNITKPTSTHYLQQSPTRNTVHTNLDPTPHQYDSPSRKITLDYSPLKQYNSIYSSPRKTFNETYKAQTSTTPTKTDYKDHEDLERKVESIRKKYSNRINNDASFTHHERNKSYVENENGFRMTHKLSDTTENIRNSPSKISKRISGYDYY